MIGKSYSRKRGSGDAGAGFRSTIDPNRGDSEGVIIFLNMNARDDLARAGQYTCHESVALR